MPSFDPNSALPSEPGLSPDRARAEARTDSNTLASSAVRLRHDTATILESICTHGLLSPELLDQRQLPHVRGADRFRSNLPSKGVVFIAGELVERGENAPGLGQHVSLPSLLDSLLLGDRRAICPITVVAERRHHDLSDELKEAGRETIESRLSAAAVVVLGFDHPLHGHAQSANFTGFDCQDPPAPQYASIPRSQIVSVLVPASILSSLGTYSTAHESPSELVRAVPDLIPLPALHPTAEIETHSLRIPNWRAELCDVIANRLGDPSIQSFGLHVVRLPTPEDYPRD